MNKIREAALSRWKKKLENEISKIPTSKRALLIKSALCGFLAGDGSVQIRKDKKKENFYRFQLDFFPDDKYMLNTYLSFVNEVYGFKPNVTIRDNVYNARLSQRSIIYDLKSLCNFGLYNWNFPRKLFKIKGAKEAWLRAFFSAEGYVGKKVIKIQSVNVKSINEVRKMLKDLKINSNYFLYKSKNKNHSPVGMIFINQKESRMNYYKKIGFWHTRKTDALKKALDL